MKRRWLCAILAIALSFHTSAALAFSGEDVLAPYSRPGANWHHRDITRDATGALEFSDAAIADIAWHADYLDSYLYNPLWWIQDIVTRLKPVLSTRDELAKLHFDDLGDRRTIESAHRRYVTGAMAGLLWAADRESVGAARHLLGLSLHAIQDFYSHSNWVDDPDRRDRTLFSTTAAQRADWNLYTGFFELPEHLGPAAHGKIAPTCTVIDSIPGGPAAMSLICAAISPISNTTLCRDYRACTTGDHATRPEELYGIDLPDWVPHDIVVFEPPGIALDNTWLAEIAAQIRPTLDFADGATLFDSAYELATDASEQWLLNVQAAMEAAGHGDFWRRVKTEERSHDREREFEHFHRFAHQFITAGPYPSVSMARQFFLRVAIDTSDSQRSGTNGDIYLQAGGHRFALDYMPGASPLISYNDFEQGSRLVYTVGPFSRLPDSITLENEAPDGRDVLRALGESFVNAAVRALEAAVELFKSIVGWDADLVGTAQRTFSAAQLAAITSTGEPINLFVDGRGEGRYAVNGWIRRSGSSVSEGRSYSRYHVTLSELYCDKESDWDRGSRSDEPFVIATLTSAPGTTGSAIFGPFGDVDRGERRPLTGSWILLVPDDVAAASLAVQVWESDDESAKSRESLRRAMAGEIEDGTEDERDSFISAFGDAVAPDWKIRSLRVDAFSRGSTVSYGNVFDEPALNQWVAGGRTASFALETDNVRDVITDVSTLERYRPTISLPPIEIPPDYDIPGRVFPRIPGL